MRLRTQTGSTTDTLSSNTSSGMTASTALTTPENRKLKSKLFQRVWDRLAERHRFLHLWHLWSHLPPFLTYAVIVPEYYRLEGMLIKGIVWKFDFFKFYSLLLYIPCVPRHRKSFFVSLFPTRVVYIQYTLNVSTMSRFLCFCRRRFTRRITPHTTAPRIPSFNLLLWYIAPCHDCALVGLNYP